MLMAWKNKQFRIAALHLTMPGHTRIVKLSIAILGHPMRKETIRQANNLLRS